MDYVITCQSTARNLAKEEINERTDMVFKGWIDSNIGIAEITSPSYLENEPIFIRHLFPIMEEIENEIDLEEKLLHFCFAHIDFEQPFSLQFRSPQELRETTNKIGQKLIIDLESSGYSHKKKETEQIISLYLGKEKGYVGYSQARENLSAWNGGEVHLSPKGTISRAELKLEEVFLNNEELFRDSKMALDLGAAPGGWTHYLLNNGYKVTAVDPAKMSPTVQTKQMKHYKMTTQQFIREVTLKEYDLIVNDMKMDIWESIPIMLTFSSYLTDEGIGIITLKLPKHIRFHKIKKSLDELSKGFRVLKTKQLFHNRSEITVILGKK